MKFFQYVIEILNIIQYFQYDIELIILYCVIFLKIEMHINFEREWSLLGRLKLG